MTEQLDQNIEIVNQILCNECNQVVIQDENYFCERCDANFCLNCQTTHLDFKQCKNCNTLQCLEFFLFKKSWNYDDDICYRCNTMIKMKTLKDEMINVCDKLAKKIN